MSRERAQESRLDELFDQTMLITHAKFTKATDVSK